MTEALNTEEVRELHRRAADSLQEAVWETEKARVALEACGETATAHSLDRMTTGMALARDWLEWSLSDPRGEYTPPSHPLRSGRSEVDRTTPLGPD